MPETIAAEPGTYSTDEVLAHLRAGDRVLVRTDFAGSTHEIVLRFDGETYYCDTPTRLHRHRTEAGMRACLEGYGYSRDDPEGIDGGADADGDDDRTY